LRIYNPPQSPFRKEGLEVVRKGRESQERQKKEATIVASFTRIAKPFYGKISEQIFTVVQV
jgi:hypothetical protein